MTGWEATMLTRRLCDLAGTWSTGRRPALWFSTCLWVCTALAAKIPSTTSWTTCGQTCLRRRLTSSRPSWEPWKDCGLPSGPAACCSTACRWDPVLFLFPQCPSHILETTYISHWIPMHIHPMIRDVNLWCTVLLQGLFHPARKVRDVYWKIYNSIYIGSQDALIAHYPQVYNDEKNVYVRYELEYVL